MQGRINGGIRLRDYRDVLLPKAAVDGRPRPEDLIEFKKEPSSIERDWDKFDGDH